MKIQTQGAYFIAALEGAKLTRQDRAALLALGNEELEEEITQLMEEADALACPKVLFALCPVAEDGSVNAVDTGSELVREKLAGKNRCFPYIATCGEALEDWSKNYAGDFLLEFFADEIKKKFLLRGFQAFREHLKQSYHTSGHLAALNPGSLPGWPISGQEALFAILGGRDFVKETVGVTYSESFLMQPSKTISGIAFESEVFYENCQHCPLERCPSRRARRI